MDQQKHDTADTWSTPADYSLHSCVSAKSVKLMQRRAEVAALIARTDLLDQDVDPTPPAPPPIPEEHQWFFDFMKTGSLS